MEKSSLIIFDIDDTLTKTAGAHQSIFIKSLQALGVKSIDTDFGAYTHHTDSYISKVIFEKDQKIEFDEKYQERFEKNLTEGVYNLKIKEIEGARQFVQNLEGQSEFAVCYATGSLRRAAEYKLKSIGLKFNPLQLVASDQIEERESILLQAIKSTKQHYKLEHFERIVSFGDGLWDLKTAQNLQLEFIGVGEKNKTIMQANGCMRHWTDFTNKKANEI